MEIWPFRFLRRGFRETPTFRNVPHEQSAGRVVVQRMFAAERMRVAGMLLFPQAGGTYAALRAFWLARSGSFEPFLYAPQNPGAAAQVDDLTAVAAQVDFDASRRYVATGSVVVKKNGVTQTLTTHYTLKNESGGAYVLGTSTKLVVRFGVAPGAAAEIEISYTFYVPVRFVGDELGDEDIIGAGAGAAHIADRTVSVELEETGPGYSYAVAPSAL
jgi:hypothetical protein